MFVVTSSGINEGKSSIVVNVGICLEKMGYSVLLIDNDIRLPSLERHFGLKVKKSGFIHLQRKISPSKIDYCSIRGHPLFTSCGTGEKFCGELIRVYELS